MSRLPFPGFYRTRLSTLLAVLACGLLAPVCAAAPHGSYVRVESIGEMLRVWRPETPLYLLGNVPLEADVLGELAGWLQDKHWTVLLVENAAGQTYTDVTGVVRSDVDAIEWGVGEGMLRRPGFARLVHPLTGEPDGAVFAIVLAQRALFYTSSEAQKSRGLGDFSSGLDQWAKLAMREGGNVAGAVTATVTNIDLEVEAAIREEALTAQNSLARGTDELAILEARLQSLHPEAASNLNLPDAKALRAQLDAAKAALDQGKAREATKILYPLTGIRGDSEVGISRIKAAIATIDWFLSKRQVVESLQARLADLERHKLAATAERELASARESLAQARELHLRAAPGYDESLQNAEYALTGAELKISRAEGLAAMQRGFQRGLPYPIAALLLGIAIVLNRRRRPAKREARSLLTAWRTALDRKLAALYDELEARVDRFVGPAHGEGQRRWQGESLELAEQIRDDVGSLTILWTSANSVLEQAEALIRARGLGAVYNLFFLRRYRRGIALLRDEPVPFDPADGLPRLFGEQRTWRDDLLGDLGSYEPFKKSLQEIVDELNLRAGRAGEGLDRFEKAVVEGPAALEETAARLQRLSGLEVEVAFGGTDDGLFLVPAAFAVASPAAAATLARARERFRHDPVAAFRTEVAEAGRIAGEALSLAERIQAARGDALPAIEAGAESLRGAGIATDWIAAERRSLSERADALAGLAAAESVGEGLEDLDRSLGGLRLRAERAAALTETLVATTRPELERVASLVKVGRVELGFVLDLPPELLLREADADPSVRVASATEEADRAHAALGHGALEEAEAALAEAARFCAEAEAIVETSCQAYADHAKALAARRAETQRLEAQVPLHERTLAEIQESFAPSVLTLRSGDGMHPNGNWTLADNVNETLGLLGLAREKADQADEVFRVGEVLRAARLLREVAGHQEQAGQRLEEIAERKSRLDRAMVSNRSLLAALDLRVREGRLSILGDPRTMQPTLEAFALGASQVEEARRKVDASPGDPLLAEEGLVAALAALEEAEKRLAPADRSAFGEAEKSVEAVARQLEAAANVAQKAEKDRVPDSAAIVQARESLETLLAEQARLREALRVEHGDWHALDAEADRIAAEAAQLAATLTGELEAAKNASTAITSAADRVREAHRYGAGVAETSAVSLARARKRLEDGAYAAAEAEAQQAHREAKQAISIAEAALAAASERRRQEHWQSNDDWGSSSSHSESSSSVFSGGASSSGSSGSSFGSSSSGSSSSSFSSGSGSSKSGW